MWLEFRSGADSGKRVQIQGGQSDPVAEARKIYDVPDPDFLQVRTVRGALMERTAKIQVDVNRRYLDEFRAVRSRASRVEDTLQSESSELVVERGRAHGHDCTTAYDHLS